MALTRVQLKSFTAFAELDLALSPGVNVLVGANGTGKTHLMKVCYVACDVHRTVMIPNNEEHSTTLDIELEAYIPLSTRLANVFLPSQGSLRRLIKDHEKGVGAEVNIHRHELELNISFSVPSDGSADAVAKLKVPRQWARLPVESVYIPVKEMLSNAPGFRSLYAQREIHFESVYADILDRSYLPPLREPFDAASIRLLSDLERAMGGEVSVKNEEFFLSGEQGDIEFTLLAEGMRKLGLLWLLIRNGSLREGSVLFWDEPETNLNPKLYGVVIDVLLELQRSGVQIFIATHDYVILRELDLQMQSGDDVAFHSLYRDTESGEIACHTARRYLDMHPNAIEEAFEDIYDRQIERSLGSFGR